MILNGALINFIGIILGSLIGLLLKNKFPKKKPISLPFHYQKK